MLQVSGLSKSYGDQVVLHDVSFALSPGNRAGLVGPNGSGKTTLLRIIGGADSADTGSVAFTPPSLTLGYLRQALPFRDDDTVQQALDRATSEHSHAWADMQALTAEMGHATPEVVLELTQRYADAEQAFQAAGGYGLQARLEAALAGLSLADLPRDLPVARLSGGQKTRLGLAGLLATEPDLLLLDEPTNHLDIEALEWLENWLRAYRGGLLVVSHDRVFLDAVTTVTLEVDPATHQVTKYAGAYSDYAAAKERERQRLQQAYENQQAELARLRLAAGRLRSQTNFRKGGKADTADKFAKGFFSDRSSTTMAKAKHIERRIERLLNEDRIDLPQEQWRLKLDLAQDASGAREVLRIEDLWLSFGSLHLLRGASAVLRQGERSVLLGPNGSGKTTLLRLIVGELQPDRGTVRLGPRVRLGYMAQEQEILDPGLTPYGLMRRRITGLDESEVRAFLHRFLFTQDEVFVPIGSLSFGERARLMLAGLVAEGCNLLVLDEPVNHLDIPSRERFEEALLQFPGTLLAVIHDRTFVQRVATAVWELREGQIRVIASRE